MRKAMTSLFILNVLLSFFVFYAYENARVTQAFFLAGRQGALNILVGEEANGRDRSKAVSALVEAARKHHALISCQQVESQTGQAIKATAYFAAGEAYLYPGILEEWLPQIRKEGLPAKGAALPIAERGAVLKLMPMEKLKGGEGPLSGMYGVSVSPEEKESLLSDLRAGFGASVEEQPPLPVPEIPSSLALRLIPLGITLLFTALAGAFQLLQRGKDIGVRKLLGHSNGAVRLSCLMEWSLLFLIGAGIGYGILGGLWLADPDPALGRLLWKSLGVTLGFYPLLLGILLLPLLLLEGITVSGAIKNSRPVRLAAAFSFLTKALLTGVLLGAFLMGMRLTLPVYGFYVENVKAWEGAEGYARVPERYQGQDGEGAEDKEALMDRQVREKRLWLEANRLGGMQILAREYEESQNPDPAERVLEELELNMVWVNENYLAEHPAYGPDGKAIQLPEGEKALFLLLPEQYSHLEDQVVRRMEGNLYSLHDLPEEAREGARIWQEGLHRKAPDIFSKDFDPIRILKVREGQEYFTYNVNLSPEEGNRVRDRMVLVCTEETDLGQSIAESWDYLIRVPEGKEPYEGIAAAVAETGLSGYYPGAYSLYDNVSSYVNMHLKALGEALAMMGVCLFAMALLILYGAVLYLERRRAELAVRLFHGYGYGARHGGHLFRTVVFYLLFLPMALLGDGKEAGLLLAFLGLLAAGDLLASFLILLLREKEHLNETLKGS